MLCYVNIVWNFVFKTIYAVKYTCTNVPTHIFPCCRMLEGALFSVLFTVCYAGRKGEPGEKGGTGDPGMKGETGPEGPPGEQSTLATLHSYSP